ncbi:hypothetical protein, partial [Rahnella sp. ChDrAdgB13]|uniref:hypothetical protein n=1 Tax=Rahnella sp. ChDrAdgB13 TaxID=1850581 RepID=UPI001AD86E55
TEGALKAIIGMFTTCIRRDYWITTDSLSQLFIDGPLSIQAASPITDITKPIIIINFMDINSINQHMFWVW